MRHSIMQRIQPAAAAFLCTLLALPAAAADFPQYPLQSGNTQVAPNILFILDDSGSMESWVMPGDDPGRRDNDDSATYRSSVINTIYYNPKAADYKPWMKADGTRWPAANFSGQPADVYAYSSTTQASGNTENLCGSNQSIVYVANTAPSTGYTKYQIRNPGGWNNNYCRWQRYASGSWSDARPSARSNELELENFVNWYNYHRTRMKVAKAGASEAFSRISGGLRVGYATINAIDKNSALVPVGINDGRFEDVAASAGVAASTNRTNWYNRLAAQGANGFTPLRGALDKAGQYFSRSDGAGPYGPEDGTDNSPQLQCRQNFTILTTDGYWNDDDNSPRFGNTAGNADGIAGSEIINHALPATDAAYSAVRYRPTTPYNEYSAAYFRDNAVSGTTSRSNTLADVAMKYWKTDLREDLDNIVPTSGLNPAFWQHMVTFGVSIGLKGTLDQTSVAQVKLDGAPKKAGASINWPNPIDSGEGAERIDDLLHAAVNGHGEFVVAANANEFADKLGNVLGTIEAQLASGSNVATDSTSFQSDTHMYQATYMSKQWTGDLVQKNLTANGIGSQNWSFAEQVVADANFRNRPVMTSTVANNGSSNGTSFPSAAQLTALARTAGSSGATVTVDGQVNADYLKGGRSNEISNGGVLRNRTGLIGDIVNSSPYYVGDTDTIYVGANDGMLHGLDAGTGDALFSYVPKGVDIAALASFSDPAYEHRFFVDGPIAVNSHSLVSGTNYLVGTLGRGGKGVFALDVSDPHDFAASDVLWDKTLPGNDTTTDPDMGFVTGVPLIVKAGNCGSRQCDPVAFVGNGIESASGNAALYAYNVRTGALLKKIVVPTATAGAGVNGLAAPRAADLDGDVLDKSDFIYAGDLHGNLWKFDVRSSNAADWDVVSYNNVQQPMFVARDAAGNRQPITGGLALAREPSTATRPVGRVLITFGTGRLVYQADLTDTSMQTMYGVYDDSLVTQSAGGAMTITDTGTSTTRNSLTGRSIAYWSADGSEIGYEDYSELPETSRGWYIDLDLGEQGGLLDVYQGERVVGGPAINKRMLRIASIAPGAGGGCGAGGSGHTHLIDAFTGTQPLEGTETGSFFDENRDGQGDTFTGQDGQQHKKGGEDAGVGMNTDSGQVDDLVLWCGSSGACVGVNTTQGGSGGQRVGWREIYSR